MKLPLLFAGALAISALAFVPAVAETNAPTQSAGQATEASHDEEAPLADAMSQLNRGLRPLRKVIKDEALMLGAVGDVVALQRLALESKSHLPAKIVALTDEAAKATETAAYHVEMNVLVRGLFDVEEAFLAGDGDAAKTALQSLEKLKRSSHERFQERSR